MPDAADVQQGSGVEEWRNELAHERTELAEERTERAEGRTELANERTFSAWVRTGIASTVAGLGIAKLLGNFDVPWLTVSIGALFIVAGAGAHALGMWGYARRSRVIGRTEYLAPSRWLFQAMVLVLIASAVRLRPALLRVGVALYGATSKATGEETPLTPGL
jgi:putative membrane protein